MSTDPFRVHHIDHVELFVPDQYLAAAWYRRYLGLEILKEHEHWAVDSGPLMISSDNGRTMLALFQGEPRLERPTAGHHRVAFRVDGPGFLHFLARLAEWPVYARAGNEGPAVSPQDVVDHQHAWSIYFCDPYGHRYEITTYDYEYVFRSLYAG